MSFSRPIQWYHSHADPISPVAVGAFEDYGRYTPGCELSPIVLLPADDPRHGGERLPGTAHRQDQTVARFTPPLLLTLPGWPTTFFIADLYHLSWPQWNAAVPIFMISVGNPDPHVFGPPYSGSISHRHGPGSGSIPFLLDVLSWLK